MLHRGGTRDGGQPPGSPTVGPAAASPAAASPASGSAPGPAPADRFRVVARRPGRLLARVVLLALVLVGGLVLTLGGGEPRVILRGPLGSVIPAAGGRSEALDAGSVGALSPAGDPADTAALTALVSRLGRALARDDESEFSSAAGRPDLVDAGAATRWRGVARSVRALGIGGQLTLTVVAPGPRFGGSEPDGTRTARIPVQVAYRLTGWDTQPALTLVELAAGRRDGRWTLVEPPAGAPATSGTQEGAGPAEPWLLGPAEVVRTAHVLLVGDATASADNHALAGRLEAATVAVRRVVATTHWNGRVVAFASRDPDYVSSWFGTTAASPGRRPDRDPATFAAEVRTSSEGVARLAVTPFMITQKDDRARAVLAHELTHVALAHEGPATLPSWLAEGTAEYVAFRGSAGGAVDPVAALNRRGLPRDTWAALRKGTWKPALPVTAAQFYGGTSAAVAENYSSAWLTCLYLASHYGQRQLFTFYAAASRSAAGDPTAAEAQALRSVLHLDRATLTRNVATFARGVRRQFT